MTVNAFAAPAETAVGNPVMSKCTGDAVTVTTGWVVNRWNDEPVGIDDSDVNSYEVAAAGAVTLLEATEPP